MKVVRAVPWRKKQGLVPRVPVGEWEDGVSCMDDDTGESSSHMHGSESLDLGDEWTNWRVDDPELESDEAAAEGVTKKRGRRFG